MTKYRLLKDLPACKAGEIVTIEAGVVFDEKRLVVGYVKAPEDWFEEIADGCDVAYGWERRGIRSKLTNLIIAPEDYAEGEKKYFTWSEAKRIDVLGWRLPTRSEWMLIAEEFGCDENGKLSSEKLRRELKLGLNGRMDRNGTLCDAGSWGHWWSSTRFDNCGAYSLYLSSYIACADNGSKDIGRSVRLVKEVE